MPRRSTSKRKRQLRNYLAGTALLAVSLGIIVIVTLVYQHLRSTRTVVDPETLCPVEGPTAIVAILIDSTDPFNGVQKDFLLKYFEELESTLKKGTLVQIFSAASYSNAGFPPESELCNPGDGRDISEWSGNPDKVRKKWQSDFKEPLDSALRSSIEGSAGDVSPIMSMIKAVSFKAFPSHGSSVPRTLYIVSDMLEHTEQYSQYNEGLDFSQVNRMPFYAHVSPNLSGTEVFVLYVSRPGLETLQTRRHAEFWADYFRHVGASLQSIKRI
jgi:hypothetical protein